MAKPILLIRAKHSTIQNLPCGFSREIEHKLKDYHILFVASDKHDDFDFQVLNCINANIDEIKELFNEEIKQE